MYRYYPHGLPNTHPRVPCLARLLAIGCARHAQYHLQGTRCSKTTVGNSCLMKRPLYTTTVVVVVLAVFTVQIAATSFFLLLLKAQQQASTLFSVDVYRRTVPRYRELRNTNNVLSNPVATDDGGSLPRKIYPYLPLLYVHTTLKWGGLSSVLLHHATHGRSFTAEAFYLADEVDTNVCKKQTLAAYLPRVCTEPMRCYITTTAQAFMHTHT